MTKPASKKSGAMVDRGEYRPIYRALYRGADFQRLSSNAKLVFHYVKGELPACGIDIWPLLTASLAEQIGSMSVAEVTDAIAELEREGWIRVNGRLVWIVRGLRFEPSMSPLNENHRKYLSHHLAGLPNGEIVREFREAYADWFTAPASHTDAKPPREGLANDKPTPFETPAEPMGEGITMPLGNPSGTLGNAIRDPSTGDPPRDSKGSAIKSISISPPNPHSTAPLLPQRVPAAAASRTAGISVGNALDMQLPLTGGGTARLGDMSVQDLQDYRSQAEKQHADTVVAAIELALRLRLAEAHAISIGGKYTPLGELSPNALRKLHPLAVERGDGDLVAAVRVLLELHAPEPVEV